MKLKVEIKNEPVLRADYEERGPCLSICTDGTQSLINHKMVEQIGLRDGMFMLLATDLDDLGNIYVRFSDVGLPGFFELKPQKNTTRLALRSTACRQATKDDEMLTGQYKLGDEILIPENDKEDSPINIWYKMTIIEK